MLNNDAIENIIKEAESSASLHQRVRAIGCLEGILLDRGFLNTGTPPPDETRDFFKRNWLGKPTQKIIKIKLTLSMFILELAKNKLLQQN